jgi:hypothetical protein
MISSLLHNLRTFAVECGGGDFLGFPTWYKYVCGTNRPFRFLPSEGQPSDIPLVMLAIIEIMLRIAALAAIAYVVFGGIKYVVSQGEPDKTSEAKGTIINALAGLLVATFAIAFVSFLGNRLG